MPKFVREGRPQKKETFVYALVDEDGSGDRFETVQSKTDTPTLYLGVDSEAHRIPSTLKSGHINRIHYRLNPTNAVTFTLRLWEAAYDADYHSNAHLLWESDPLQADDTDYDKQELDIRFILITTGKMYYSIEWTGATGNTTGFIYVSGESD